jgi:calcium-dependent protein kinase
VQHKHSHEPFACKILPKKVIKKGQLIDNTPKIEKELSIWDDLSHLPNICKLHEVCDDINNVYFIQELCNGGSLYDKAGTLHIDTLKSHMKDLLRTIISVHEMDILYADLKPQNVLLTTENSNDIRLIDFGCSQYMKGTTIRSGFVGTPVFCAPEVWDRKLSFLADSWSYGVVLYYMLSQKYPFWYSNKDEFIDSTSLSRVRNDILNNDIIDHPLIPSQAMDLIKKLLNKDVEERMPCHEAVKHPWFRRN